MRLWIPKFLHETLGHPLMSVFGLIMAVVTLTTFGAMVESQRSIIEHEAIKIAEVVARQALASRSVYTEAVTEKLVRDGCARKMWNRCCAAVMSRFRERTASASRHRGDIRSPPDCRAR
jgi:hypothetical protein